MPFHSSTCIPKKAKAAWGQVLRFWQRHQIDCFDKKIWCDIQWTLFKWHNTLAKTFHFTQIRLLNVIVPSAITYLLKQVRRLIPFWFKLYMHSPQSGLHDTEKLLQYQKHAHLPTWQGTKHFIYQTFPGQPWSWKITVPYSGTLLLRSWASKWD